MISFPLRYIAIEIPLHDTAWNGSVCGHPARNKQIWADKKQWYRANGMVPLAENAKSKKVLIVSKDEPGGRIDSARVAP